MHDLDPALIAPAPIEDMRVLRIEIEDCPYWAPTVGRRGPRQRRDNRAGTVRIAKAGQRFARDRGTARGHRTAPEVALWGVLTGESPDEVVVDVDAERDVLIVHTVDASDPAVFRFDPMLVQANLVQHRP